MIEAPEFILSTVSDGYKIPFKVVPSYSFIATSLAKQSKSFYKRTAKISEVRSPEQLHVVNPLSVSVQSSKKKRFILDLRIVNKCVYKQKFKFKLRSTLRKEDF